MGMLESLANALRGLLANKLRSALTMLGVIIGVGAIMTTTSIGEGGESRHHGAHPDARSEHPGSPSGSEPFSWAEFGAGSSKSEV